MGGLIMKIFLVFVGVLIWIIVMACCNMSSQCFKEEEARDETV